jgi:hypothetical protein
LAIIYGRKQDNNEELNTKDISPIANPIIPDDVRPEI